MSDIHIRLIKIHSEYQLDRKTAAGLDYTNGEFPVSKRAYDKIEVKNTTL